VIVGGDPSKRGVVSTCSYEARKFGVRSAMSLFEAKKRCPQGIFIEGDFSLYRDYSEQVMEILSSFSPITECVGIDEAYMDVSSQMEPYGGAFKMGQLLRQAVFTKTSLTCSIGIGSNKLIAKIASSLGKPNGLYEIPYGKEAEFLSPLTIEKIPGIGAKTQLVLNKDGIKIVEDLQKISMEELINRYGAFGYYIHFAAMGKDSREVEVEDQAPKSVGAETTFEVDQSHREVLQEELIAIFNKAYRRFRKHKMRTRGISLKLRFSDFKTITRSLTFDTHINDYQSLLDETLNFFDQIYPGMPLRLIGISFEKLSEGYWQPTLWDWLKENDQFLY
jgi:nucleotidyltransferase/DNA polymerase involved in DNA repair